MKNTYKKNKGNKVKYLGNHCSSGRYQQKHHRQKTSFFGEGKETNFYGWCDVLLWRDGRIGGNYFLFTTDCAEHGKPTMEIF
jgi:hypothetical protein